MKIIEKIADASNVVFSFEFWPPRPSKNTDDGVEDLLEKMEKMVAYNPIFCDITWGAGGSRSAMTLDVAKKMQNLVCVETMIHLICTDMTVEDIDKALDNIKSNGIQNVLALRGDPPRGLNEFVPVPRGLSCALDLVTRADYLSGRTALHFAAVNGHVRCIRLVVADFVPSSPFESLCDQTVDDRVENIM